jgi:protein-S-isoprenylcysteine O-methyltransferase Ste14
MKKNYQSLQNNFKTWKSKNAPNLELAQRHWLFLSPAGLVCLIGLSLFCWMSWPTMLTGLVVMLLGVCLLALSWSFIKFKNKVERFVKDLEGRVIIGGLGMHENQQRSQVEQVPAKKILYH